MIVSRAAAILCGAAIIYTGSIGVQAQEGVGRKEFRAGAVRQLNDLPATRLRNQIDRLPLQARERALSWLGNFHFTEQDLPSLHADPSGAIFYEDHFEMEALPQVAESEPVTANAAVPVNPMPASLKFHSKPGSVNVLYLNFVGETVTGTAWNTSIGRTSIPAVGFSIDSDFSIFSDAEQLAIRRIWQRVAEDYAAFNIDVTTERPTTFSTRTAHALITRDTDANGEDNPSSSAGGVAYVNVFGNSNYATYRPAWIYYNNLANEESFIAEAASHEVGHNMGLSHDGKTGSDYYGGHGSGETSWGPIMGTGYNRNVSQWSKGEYYQASNTQDDLAAIATKLTYRADDHGSSSASATALTISGGVNIVSTTPENDPSNSSPVNKGILERNTDIDVFSFATGSGAINISVRSWVVPSGLTRGGNIDVWLQLFNSAGQLIATNNDASLTGASIQANVVDGIYYLWVRNTRAGSPTSSNPTGYTAYGGIGQYFISGTITASGATIPPGAEVQVTDISQSNLGSKQFTVTYSDNVAIDVATLGNNDIRVTGPNGYNAAASFVSVDVNSDGTPRIASYRINPPGGVWGESDNGTYHVVMQPNAVSDAEGAFVPGQELGTFEVTVPQTLYFANMDVDPGWTFEGLWEYGRPLYLLSAGPTAGFTGTNIIGYNLSGNYENRLPPTYTTTPVIDCGGVANLALKFRRWLRLRSSDEALIEVSTNGTSWTAVWSSTQTIDNAWQEVQYSLPTPMWGSSSLQIRWGLSSGQSGTDIGWNIDDVEILGNGNVDTTPPVAVINVANVTSAGAQNHTFTVTYSDDRAVSVGTLDSTDLVVTGPNGFSNLVAFAGVDLPTDGTPRVASYEIGAPGGSWDSSDNGIYQVYLRADEVSDSSGIAIPGSQLGTFTVAIAGIPQELLVQPVTLDVQEGSNSSFTVRLAQQPSADVVVNSLVVSGDSDISVASGASITFNSNNWSNAVPVSVTAANDADQLSGRATIECKSEGLASVSVIVSEQDTTTIPPSVSLTGPLDGATFLTTDNILFSANATDDGNIVRVEFFANNSLLGTDTTTPYSFSAELTAGVYDITAKATDDTGAITVSAAARITVSVPNQAPTVTVTAPLNGESFTTTNSIAFTADASDDDTVSHVEFFVDNNSVGNVTAPPYVVSLQLQAGTYVLTAAATDNVGVSSMSSSVSITVTTPNTGPSITLSSPQADKVLCAPGTITLQATAQDSDGNVTKVEFFRGTTSVGSISTAPFELTLADVPPGIYSFTAAATDDRGAESASTAITLGVAQEPSITEIIRMGDTDQLEVEGTTGIAHILETSADFRNWSAVATNTPVAGQVSFTDIRREANQFYRVVVRSP